MCSATRARVILRYADSKELLISGLVEGGDEIAQHPAVLDVPAGKGHVVLFSINPVYRGETRGTYSLVLNTILNFDSLDAGRKLAEQKAAFSCCAAQQYLPPAGKLHPRSALPR